MVGDGRVTLDHVMMMMMGRESISFITEPICSQLSLKSSQSVCKRERERKRSKIRGNSIENLVAFRVQ